MIDFHTHILPCMDDGSQSVEMSMAMLASMREQGVRKVIATPHFYANDESVENFIERRSAARNLLPAELKNGPEIILGAEVKYYDGISGLSALKKLRIENSRLLLLEMPYSKWTESAVREVIDIASRGKITLVLAHIERFLPMQNKKILYQLLNSGVLLQVNASYFCEWRTKGKALRMLRNNQIHFIGSDCHNTSDRAPNTVKAYSLIQKKLGEAVAADFVNYGYGLFEQNQII